MHILDQGITPDVIAESTMPFLVGVREARVTKDAGNGRFNIRLIFHDGDDDEQVVHVQCGCDADELAAHLYKAADTIAAMALRPEMELANKSFGYRLITKAYREQTEREINAAFQNRVEEITGAPLDEEAVQRLARKAIQPDGVTFWLWDGQPVMQFVPAGFDAKTGLWRDAQLALLKKP